VLCIYIPVVSQRGKPGKSLATSLPYLASNKNIEQLFTAIASAKVPDRFTQDFLASTIGLSGSNDRQMIPLLRSMHFIDQSGSPLATYRLLKSKDTAKQAIAEGIRQAYAPLFASNENANTLASDKLKGLVSQVAGTDDDMTARIFGTLSALLRQADFSSIAPPQAQTNGQDEVANKPPPPAPPPVTSKGMRPEFHYNLQIHLPNNATEDVYLNIFNALRKTFQ
jgi:Family of unknown function (DUF5343)